jgi:hypothetical protein
LRFFIRDNRLDAFAPIRRSTGYINRDCGKFSGASRIRTLWFWPNPSLTLLQSGDRFCPSAAVREDMMCRNIKTLHNFKPPATDDEIRASALQFVRKLSGSTRPSKANQIAFDRAVDEVARTARQLLDALVTTAPPRNRDDEAAKARARAVERYRPALNAAP